MCCEKEGPFEVTVVDPDSQPVAGAWIEGGMDWEFFSVQTDSEGVAILPDYARGEGAVIFKNNFFSLIVSSLTSTTYVLTHTLQELELIGEAKGRAIRFEPGIIITLGYTGDYHVYSYNDQGVNQIASAQLPSSVKTHRLFGDTLWFSTHDDGIYVYSLQDPYQPQQLFHLAITGYLGPFARKDTIVVVIDPWAPSPVRIFSFTYDGQFQELTTIGNFYVEEMTFIDHYLILVGDNTCLPTVFDLADPTQPILVYSGLEWEYQSGFLFNNYLIMIPNYASAAGLVYYTLKDLSDPTNPPIVGSCIADAWLTTVIDSNNAVGNYVFHERSFSILTGDVSTQFTTAVIVSESRFYYAGLGGARPPYYIIDDQLWKLKSR